MNPDDLFGAALRDLDPKPECTSTGVSTEATEEPRPRRSQSAELVEIAEGLFRLGVSTEGEAFAVPIYGAPLARPLRGGRDSLRAALAKEYAARTRGRVASGQALADALLVLQGRAQDADPEELALRVARHDGDLIVDLGDSTGRAVRVAPSGWAVEPRSPVLFRRAALTAALPGPTRTGRLDDLWTHLPVAPALRPLLLAWMLATFMPAVRTPVLDLRGEQGTGKTTATRRLVDLLDPSPAPTRSAPRDAESWIVAAAGSNVVGLDNLAGIAPWLSDALCRAVTGDGLVRRKLYTDGELSVIALRRSIILNGIDLGGLRGDLADRMVRIDLERIDPSDRRLDDDLERDWSSQRPELLGALLDLAVKVLAVLPDVRPQRLPRMADYARLLAAVDRVLGTDGLGAYAGQAGRLAVDVVEGDPVAGAVVQLAENRPGWHGTGPDLYALLTPERAPRGWPTDARALTAAIRLVAPALRAVGVEVNEAGREPKTGRKLWRITPRPEIARESCSPRSPRSPAPAQAADHDKQGEGRGEQDEHPRSPSAHPPLTPALTPAQSADQRKQAPANRGEQGEQGIRPFSGLVSGSEPHAPRSTQPAVAACAVCGRPVRASRRAFDLGLQTVCAGCDTESREAS